MKAFALNSSKAVIACTDQSVTFTGCGSFYLLSGPTELQAAKEAIEYALNYGDYKTSPAAQTEPAYRGGYQPIGTAGPVQPPPRKP